MNTRHKSLCFRGKAGWHLSAICLAGILMLATTAISCQPFTPDEIMRLSLARGTPDEEAVSEQLCSLALSDEMTLDGRLWALRALGRLQKHPLATVERLGSVVASGSCSESWRAYAAWTLGQMHRKEAVPYLVEALSTPLSSSTSYYVLEALAEGLRFVLDDVELNQRAVASLHHFASIQSGLIGDMYELVNEYLSNLVVLAVTLEAAQKAAVKESASPSAKSDLYVSVQRTLLHLFSNKARYLAAFGDKKAQLERVLDLALSDVATKDQPLWLLTAWYAGALSDNAEFSGLVARRLAGWLGTAPPSVRLVLIWALARSERFSQTSRTTLLEQVFRSETDPNVLELLARISSSGNTLDVFQKTLGIVPAPSKEGGK